MPTLTQSNTFRTNSVFDNPKNYFVCGSSWIDASASCKGGSYPRGCPGGSNDECEDGDSCWSDTTCNMLDFPPLPTSVPTSTPISYGDPMNNKFCGSSYFDAEERCSTETHCPSGNHMDCPNGGYCWEVGCNIVDIAIETGLNETDSDAEFESSEGGDGEETWMPTCPPEFTGGLADPTCGSYATCDNGFLVGSVIECTSGTLYNEVLGVCDHEASVICHSSTFGGEGEEEEVGLMIPTASPSPTTIGTTASSTTTSTGSMPHSTPVPTITHPSSTSSSTSTRMPNANIDFDQGTPSNAIGDDTANEGELEDEDWTDEGEEDWTYDTGADTSTMSLWCGESQSNAYKNCNREGYDCPDGVCFNGLKCLTVSCDEESEGIDDDSSSQIETSSSPTLATYRNNVGVLGQFCAETFEALETACATATICEVPEDCPSGTYCWKEYMCGGTVSMTSPSVTSALTSTNSPSLSLSGTYFCGTDRAHASTSCHKQCPNGLNEDCDDGETCFAYVTCGDGSTSAPTPESESAEQPSQSQELAMSSSQQPTRGNVVSSPPQTADTVQQLFCASTKEELEASCLTAPSCISEPCPSKLFCFPYTCVEAVDDDNSTQASTAPAEDQGSPATVESTPAPVEINQLQCPQSEFVGWHTSKDCKGE